MIKPVLLLSLLVGGCVQDALRTEIRCYGQDTRCPQPLYRCGEAGRCVLRAGAINDGALDDASDAQVFDGTVDLDQRLVADVAEPPAIDYGQMDERVKPDAGEAVIDARLDAQLDAEPDARLGLRPPPLPGWAPLTERFLVVPGRFLQGESAERSRGDDVPRRVVTVSPFYIDRIEVTVRAWSICAGQRICDVPECPLGGPEADPFDPVRCVSHAAAADYCTAMGGRLPTEAEWERVARGTCEPPEGAGCEIGAAARIYPWGDAPPSDNRARFGRFDTPHPADTRPDGASPSGLLNLMGNVAEWTADCYARDAYETLPADDPANVVPGCDEIVVRGGYFASAASDLGVSRRDRRVPMASPEIGLRCAYDVQ